MARLPQGAIVYIGLVLEGFFYGLYSGIFAIYLQYQTSKKDSSRTQNTIFYSLSFLYLLSASFFFCDAAPFFLVKLSDSALIRIVIIGTVSFGCCDFIAQFILIYRCWIVWGHNIRVAIMPALLTFAFLATWIAYNGPSFILSGELMGPDWGPPVILTSLGLSLAVNALVTGLIVFKIVKVFRQVKVTSDDQILGVTGGTKLRHVIFILIESGMALFCIQFARLMVTIWPMDRLPLNIIITVHEMLTGITPTIIVVRTTMGLSFHDEKSMEEVVIGSLHFASNHPNSVSETESINIVGRDTRIEGGIDVQQDYNIDVVER